jgi:polysaccharide chain length determinant protein (PEP-CTERM system associated)
VVDNGWHLDGNLKAVAGSAKKRDRQATFLDLIRALRRRMWLIFLCLCLALGPVIYYNRTAAPVYEAETTIGFEENREIIPALGVTRNIYGRSFITNQIQEITSRTLSEEVVHVLPDWVIGEYTASAHSPTELGRLETAARRIRKRISAEPVRDADIIRLKVQAGDPQAAATVANAISEVLRERRLQIKREESSGLRQFIESQIEVVGQQLRSVEEALKEFKETNRITYLDQESQEILRRMTEAEVLYNKAKAERMETDQRLSYIHRKIAEERQGIVPAITDITSPWTQKLKEQLVDLEVQYTTLLVQDYPEDHPQMVNLKQQIEHTKKSLTEEMLKVAEGKDLIEPLSQIEAFLKESVMLGVDYHAYKARETALYKTVESYNRKLESLPEKELQLAQLSRAKEVNNRTYMMLLERAEEARISEAAKISDIRVIDPAIPPESPIRPRKAVNIILGVVIGSAVGIGLAVFLESLDTSIKTSQDVQRTLALPALGMIPAIKGEGGKMKKGDRTSSLLISHQGNKSSSAEAYRSLRTNLHFANLDRPLSTLVITSALPQEGKTLTVANLGIAIAQFGVKTLLIDSDLRRPMLHRLFGRGKEPGLSDVLVGSVDLHAAIQTTHIPNLWILPSGTIPPDPAELIASQKMRDLLFQVKGDFHIIVCDSPPVIAVTDAALLATETDGIALVVHSGKTEEDAVRQTKVLLEQVNANIFGVILNNIQVDRIYGRHSYYYRYSYYYTPQGKKIRRRERKKKAAAR